MLFITLVSNFFVSISVRRSVKLIDNLKINKCNAFGLGVYDKNAHLMQMVMLRRHSDILKIVMK